MKQSLLQQQGQMWLEKGIAAARAGKRLEAREALFRALNDESRREMAWLWLAAVADDKRQERLYLEKVLSINPENRYARSGLETLDARQAVVQPPPTEVAPQTDTVPAPAAPADGGPEDGAGPDHVGQVEGGSAPTASVKVATPIREPDNTEEISSVAEAVAAQGLRPHEPSGWTTRSEPVKPTRTGYEPSGWTRATPRIQPTRPADSAARMRTDRPAPAPAPRTAVNASLIMSDLFGSHENWTVTMAAVSLILLAVLLAVLAIASALAG